MCQGGDVVTHHLEEGGILWSTLPSSAWIWRRAAFRFTAPGPDGSVAFRKKLSRAKVLDFVASQPRCVVAMEACASAHHWGRAFGELGHEVKLVPPVYVKPFVKRQKNDAADTEAICAAASRPTTITQAGRGRRCLAGGSRR